MLELESIATTSLPLEVAGLLPASIVGKSLAEIERFEVLHGNRRLALAEFFSVGGTANRPAIVMRGGLRHVHRLGHSMAGGRIIVEGDVGRHLGARMTGGEIEVHGNTGDFAGCAMGGGLIRVRGNAGNYSGAAYAGSTRGMRGGTLIVHGNAGSECGQCMRRGLFAVGGSIGEFAGMDMQAGSLLVFGDCGSRVGAGMRRGTIVIFGKSQPLLPTFRRGGRTAPVILQMLLVHLAGLALAEAANRRGANYDQYHGDLVSLGRGEILVAAD